MERMKTNHDYKTNTFPLSNFCQTWLIQFVKSKIIGLRQNKYWEETVVNQFQVKSFYYNMT